MPKSIDITGQYFGFLLVISKLGKTKSGNYIWLVRCRCGKEFEARQGNLHSGNTKSCGVCTHIKHGHSINHTRSPEYHTWHGMIQRCTNPHSRKYYLYGGRGIRVCQRWRNFENFLKDMGSRPDGLTLDRVDGNGDYEPNNCRWATAKQQARNIRR